jgi:hypothetical protein
MINVTVDGNSIDPGQLEMHQQNDPFPGGCRYTLRIVDPELAQVVALDFPQAIQQVLTPSQMVDLFNLLRPYVSLKLGRRKSLFWANTVDELKITDNSVELSGVCSPHVS